jgi:hypothetical protein
MLAALAGLGGLALVAAGSTCKYERHWDRIGPKTEQAKKDEVSCSSRAACPLQAAAACNAASNCSTFGTSANWHGGATAQLYSTGWSASIADSGWSLYTCVGDGPAPGSARASSSAAAAASASPSWELQDRPGLLPERGV